MTTLRVTVQIGGSSPLEDTAANRARIFTFAAGPQGSSTGSIAGNIRAQSTTGEGAYNLNGPRIPGSLSVTSYSAAKFVSEDLTGLPSLVGQLSTAVEKGYIVILDEEAAITGQTGAAASMAAVSGNTITVTGLTGMTAASLNNYLTISGATTGTNNGTFLITKYLSATSVEISADGAPGNDVSNGALTWTEKGDVMDRTSLSTFL